MTELGYPKLLTLSHWNATKINGVYGTGNWKQAKAMGISGAVIRAGSCDNATGKCYEDFAWRAHVKGCLDVELPFALYWYLRPNWDRVEQAKYFMQLYRDALDMMMATRIRFIIRQVADLEVNGGLAKNVVTDRLELFLSILDNKHKMIYCGGSFWNDWIEPRSHWKSYEYFVARWNLEIDHPWSDGKYKPHSFTDWTLWQYCGDDTAKIPIEPYGFYTQPKQQDPDSELIYFNGSIDDLGDWFDLSTVETLPRYVVPADGCEIVPILNEPRYYSEVVDILYSNYPATWLGEVEGWVEIGYRQYVPKSMVEIRYG